MKKIIELIFAIMLCITTYSQTTTLSVLGHSYHAVSFVFTSYISYGDDRLFPDKDINIKIAKNGTVGLLEIVTDLPADKDLCNYFRKCGIYGDIMLELSNGDTIVCNDKGISDFLDGKVSAIYTLSAENMETLRKANIEIIRFNMQTFNSKGSYVAANFHHKFSDTPDEFTKRKEKVLITKVPKLIKMLK